MSDHDMSDDEDDLERAKARKLHENAVQPTGGASTSLADTQTMGMGASSKDSQTNKSALPPAARPRDSFDGETIFAVGDDGADWSDGSDDDGDEGRKLTRKISPP